MSKKSLFLIVLSFSLITLSSCKKKKPASVDQGQSIGESKIDENISEEIASTEGGDLVSENSILDNLPVIYFEFEQASLTDEARSLLQEIATALNAFSSASLTIEGHCDERGSNEYNLALGERRARSVLQYLQQLGVNYSRLTPVSYGEERPNQMGSFEGAWNQNRRVEFSVSR